MTMTVVVTGASGHIGANLLRVLTDSGFPTRSLIHVNHRGTDGLDTEIVRGDVRDIESLCQAFRGAEMVYHLAGCISLSMKDWPRLESINVTGTRNVVEACIRAGVKRLVHFSSIHALQPEPLSVPVDESRPLSDSPDFPPYDRSKAEGEKEVRRGIERGLDAVIIYPTAVVGPYDYEPSYLGRALLGMARRKLPALVNGGYDWVDVRDVVRGAVTAGEKASCGERYILSGHWLSLRDISGVVAGITGMPPTRLTFPLGIARLGVPVIAAVSKFTGQRPLYTRFSLRALRSNRNMSHDKASRELGYQPRPFRETMGDTLEWFRDNGQLPDSAIINSERSA
jgi:dihydroflavonol-4-reductase